MTSYTPAIEVAGLTKAYGDTTVLDGVESGIDDARAAFARRGATVATRRRA